MEENKKYVCAYCGAEYDTPLARAKCEMECDMKREQEAERIRNEDFKREQKERAQECADAYQTFCNLADKFRDDYGKYPVVSFSDAVDPVGKLLQRLFW